ncbi:MAG: hypothetical protein JJU32_14215 [Phormidium sp. BM_Day4_Bin.17]|nr:hypothetical protein [Phormidium sp. BM_Day4_Bin.17]UCJ13239.1 MAG: hypothetical protein JWS08_05520 [Phormidium sp. PBR-2020]
MNTFELGEGLPFSVDYGELLEKILRELRQEELFRVSQGGSDRLMVNVDAIAQAVAQQQIKNPIFGDYSARSATLNLTVDFRDRFNSIIHNLRQDVASQLQQQLDTTGFDINDLLTPLTEESWSRISFAREASNSTSVPIADLETRTQGRGGDSLLKFHKVTITVGEVNQFSERMEAGLNRYLDDILTDEDELQEAQEAVQERLIDSPGSDFYRLQRVMDRESLGRLKKEAKICYLEYLSQQIDREQHPEVVYLDDLIRRLRDIDEYISQHPYGHYSVNYRGVELNYKDWFSRSESLDALPIIPILSDILGETTNDSNGDRIFTFGLKLKFGNEVQARGGDPVFDYYCNILNPDKWEENIKESERDTVARKVLRVLFLYYFVFAYRPNPNATRKDGQPEAPYDVISSFNNNVLPIFNGSNEENKANILRLILKGFKDINVSEKIRKLRDLLKGTVKGTRVLPPQVFQKKIGVFRGILRQSPNSLGNGDVFDDVVSRNPKECLRYITIKDDFTSDDTFCQLPVHFKFEDIRYYSKQETESFDCSDAETDTIYQLPVLITPRSRTSSETSQRYLGGTPLVVIAYNNRYLDPEKINLNQGFVYRFTMSLLMYISLRVILDALDLEERRLFIPLLRFHEGNEQNPSPAEKFMANLSKVVVHLLGERYWSNSQGIRIKTRSTHTIRNAFASLYSVLPQTYEFNLPQPQDGSQGVDKLALLVVSSLESDGVRRNRHQYPGISTLFGEAIAIDNDQGKITIQPFKTFSENYGDRQLYNNPSILSDLVLQLHQAGYRHIIYLAQAPYTNRLNLSQIEENRNLYFMSPNLIKFLVDGLDDLHLYPVFVNQYSVLKLKKLNDGSYRLRDTQQLLNILNDPSQHIVVFFNLFNGITVGRDGRFYNGVMSYSTLINVYPDILDDQDIRQGLIYEGPVKTDILRYLTLFHFFRVERRKNKPELKLDPYQQIMGDEALRKNALFYHMDGKTYFNSLAFLTAVNSILYPQSNERQER